MTNNLTTIAGCMQEAVDRLENNLQTKGVDAKYDSSKGLLSLIDEIENIVPQSTSVLSITSPANNSSIYSNDSLTVTGTLVTENSEPISNASIQIIQNNNIITTLITDNNGGFTGTINSSNLSSGTITIKYNGNNNYTECTTNINITIENKSISLNGSKNILSYYSEESCTLNAFISGDNINNQTVQLYKMIGNSPNISNDIFIGNMTDNGRGHYIRGYTATGAGDIYFYAKWDNCLSEVYHIFDEDDVNIDWIYYSTDTYQGNGHGMSKNGFEGMLIEMEEEGLPYIEPGIYEDINFELLFDVQNGNGSSDFVMVMDCGSVTFGIDSYAGSCILYDTYENNSVTSDIIFSNNTITKPNVISVRYYNGIWTVQGRERNTISLETDLIDGIGIIVFNTCTGDGTISNVRIREL